MGRGSALAATRFGFKGVKKFFDGSDKVPEARSNGRRSRSEYGGSHEAYKEARFEHRLSAVPMHRRGHASHCPRRISSQRNIREVSVPCNSPACIRRARVLALKEPPSIFFVTSVSPTLIISSRYGAPVSFPAARQAAGRYRPTTTRCCRHPSKSPS
jgi:hypothetical protein